MEARFLPYGILQHKARISSSKVHIQTTVCLQPEDCLPKPLGIVFPPLPKCPSCSNWFRVQLFMYIAGIRECVCPEFFTLEPNSPEDPAAQAGFRIAGEGVSPLALCPVGLWEAGQRSRTVPELFLHQRQYITDGTQPRGTVDQHKALNTWNPTIIRWLDGITDTMDMSLSKFLRDSEDSRPWHAAILGVPKSWI